MQILHHDILLLRSRLKPDRMLLKSDLLTEKGDCCNGRSKLKMNRRNFISQNALITTGYFVAGKGLVLTGSSFHSIKGQTVPDLYELFRNPGLNYHPYVRWWWNGDK